MTPVEAADGVIAYERHEGGERLGVALNLTREARPLPFRGTVLLSTVGDGGGEALGADEGTILSF